MHNIELSPAANSILEDYAIRCLTDNGEECALAQGLSVFH